MPETVINLPAVAPLIMSLQEHGIDPVLYGSLGVSHYLGEFKQFGDVDLLVPPRWLHEDWGSLRQTLADMAFHLVNEREHEFERPDGMHMAFAEEAVLVRDGILATIDDLVAVNIGACTVRTLTAQQFKAAYQFSVKDGYRKEQRGKKDAGIIHLLDDYIAAHPPQQ